LNPYSLSVAGAKTARKVMDKTMPSNRLMESWRETEGKPV
jgi:carboxymethylenebutenolidase